MTIAEVSKQYNIPVDTLRYYERIGLLPPVNRSKSGFRDYTEGDRQWVSFIKCMRALIDYVTLFQQGDSTREARRQILVEQREALQGRVDELQRTLDYLTEKIRRYDEWNPATEERLLGSAVPQGADKVSSAS